MGVGVVSCILWVRVGKGRVGVHDKDVTIGTCVNQGKLCESVSKRIVRRAAGAQAIEMAVATRAPLCSMPVRFSSFSRDRQVCSSVRDIVPHSGMLLCMR